ncbi:TIGR03086 family metal-binding protein [Allorhizocola rhizosphaerae]|uniref:TIGR03086 family metal-binding protein n=1 Tax=Allorhizocola rhizosphaerae TaxID=1872709 RepID=UPI001FE467E7|nr:TIGR03086 family metal-binding protein [Allorhizocola rhizosphaerae]
MDPREYDRRVLESIDPTMRRVAAENLSLPTPCTGWTLGDLVRHMAGSHFGWAFAARGDAPDPAVWAGPDLGKDPYLVYRESADAATAAFADPDLLSRSLQIHGYGTIPAAATLHMHAVDFLAHGWDVAMALGIEPVLDEELCAHGLAIAQRWPEVAFGSGDPFAAHVPIDDAAPTGLRLMAYLGRDPHWTPSS